jgi:hypothetical protein
VTIAKLISAEYEKCGVKGEQYIKKNNPNSFTRTIDKIMTGEVQLRDLVVSKLLRKD